MSLIYNDWIIVKPDDNNSRVFMFYENYMVDVKHVDCLDIVIKQVPNYSDYMSGYIHDEAEPRRITLTHKINIDSFITELVELLCHRVHLSKTESYCYRDTNSDGSNGKLVKILISPIRDIYEGIQGLVVKY